ncbi:MAG: hypothetical protein K2J31_05605 [Alistipes sp.]|nr:hypothetical protein [Alistipes sp.]
MLIKRFAVMMLAVMTAGIVACEKESEPTVPEPEPLPEALGSYTFGDTEYDIRFAAVYDNGDSYSFIFSPLTERPLTTYFAVSLRNYFVGATVDVAQLYHNDDYSFVYEDPICYYSQLYALRSGTMLIKKNSSDHYTVDIDVKLADGTPIKMNFTGNIYPEQEEE